MKYLHKLGSAQAAHPVKWVALAAMGLTLSACSTHGDIQGRLSALESGKLGLQQATLAEVDAAPQAWWTGYGDRQLASPGGRRALADNPSVGANTLAACAGAGRGGTGRARSQAASQW